MLKRLVKKSNINNYIKLKEELDEEGRLSEVISIGRQIENMLIELSIILNLRNNLSDRHTEKCEDLLFENSDTLEEIFYEGIVKDILSYVSLKNTDKEEQKKKLESFAGEIRKIIDIFEDRMFH